MVLLIWRLHYKLMAQSHHLLVQQSPLPTTLHSLHLHLQMQMPPLGLALPRHAGLIIRGGSDRDFRRPNRYRGPQLTHLGPGGIFVQMAYGPCLEASERGAELKIVLSNLTIKNSQGGHVVRVEPAGWEQRWPKTTYEPGPEVSTKMHGTVLLSKCRVVGSCENKYPPGPQCEGEFVSGIRAEGLGVRVELEDTIVDYPKARVCVDVVDLARVCVRGRSYMHECAGHSSVETTNGTFQADGYGHNPFQLRINGKRILKGEINCGLGDPINVGEETLSQWWCDGDEVLGHGVWEDMVDHDSDYDSDY